MGMRILNLYVDDDSILLAKHRGINLSQMFREVLHVELGFYEEGKETVDDKMNYLKIKLARMSSEMREAKEEIKILKRRLKEATGEGIGEDYDEF